MQYKSKLTWFYSNFSVVTNLKQIKYYNLHMKYFPC